MNNKRFPQEFTKKLIRNAMELRAQAETRIEDEAKRYSEIAEEWPACLGFVNVTTK